MDASSFSILFDNPRKYLNQHLKVNESLTVLDIETLINLKLYRRLFCVYLSLVLCQYLLIFLSIPMDPIENRPPLAVISPILLIFSFVFHSMLLPACTVLMPNRVTRTLLIQCCVSQLLVLLHTTAAAVVVLATKDHMFLVEAQGETRIDVTLYLQGVWLVNALGTCVTLLVLTVITIMASRAIVRVETYRNRLQERKTDTVEFPMLPLEFIDKKRLFMP